MPSSIWMCMACMLLWAGCESHPPPLFPFLEGDTPAERAMAQLFRTEIQNPQTQAARARGARARGGWHRWEQAPVGCDLEVPDHLTDIEPLSWKSCPSQMEGCSQLQAPWAERSGWGFGGLLSEIDLFQDDVPIGAWRFRVPESNCVAGGPWLGPDGRAALVVIRADAENEPWVYVSDSRTLIEQPERIERFGKPEAAVVSRDVAFVSGDLLVLFEHFGRFCLRHLTTGSTERPSPGARVKSLHRPTIAQGKVFYTAWDGRWSSMWMHTAEAKGREEVRLSPRDGFQYDGLVTDGASLAWVRSGEGRHELWAMRLPDATSFGGSACIPRRLASLKAGSLPRLSMGGGWLAAAQDDRIRLFSLSGRKIFDLPRIPGQAFVGGSQSLVLAGSAVFVKTYPEDGFANDVRFITRFEIRPARGERGAA
jgi:hypothetical protein